MKGYLPPETLLRRLTDEGITTFTKAYVRRRFRFDSADAGWRLQALVHKGRLRRFLHGWYVVRGPVEAEVLGEPMFLGTRLLDPSYVAFGSALHVHGWTERAPRVTFIASPRFSRIRHFGGHPFHIQKLPATLFFGSALARRGSLEFPVADPEKAIVDAFYLPQHAGGMAAVVAAAAKARASLDLETLEAYAVQMDNRSLCSRLGYVLEALGEEPRSLRPHASAVPVKLNHQGPRRGRRISRWHIIDNL